MKNLKKLLIFALTIALAVTVFAGCSSNKDTQNPGETQTDTNASAPETPKKVSIGLVQFVQHEALDAATEGFKDALTELLGEENVSFDLQNAAGDSATCSTIVSQFVAADVDLIFANATPALQAAAAATSEIPIVGTSITDYATALDISDWTGTTGRNITGTADLAPLAEQAAMFKELLPDVKKVGLLYCSGEANSKYQVDIVADELTKLGYEPTLFAFADSNDVAAVTQTACDNSEALYIPTDNTVASNAEIVTNIATPANIPIIAGEEGICKGCGLATLSISYYSIGHVAGEMAYDILVNGEDPSTMEIRYADELTKKYVPERMEQFGLTAPEGYETLSLE